MKKYTLCSQRFNAGIPTSSARRSARNARIARESAHLQATLADGSSRSTRRVAGIARSHVQLGSWDMRRIVLGDGERGMQETSVSEWLVIAEALISMQNTSRRSPCPSASFEISGSCFELANAATG